MVVITVSMCGYGVLYPVFARTTTFTQTIIPAPQSARIVDERGEDIVAPTITLTPTIVNGVLGTDDERLRIANPVRDAEWSVTIAPVDGPRALWTGSRSRYDMNDAGPEDGPDIDVSGGRLSIDPSSARIQSVTNAKSCPVEGLSLGSPSSFSEYHPAYGSISLLSGSAMYASYCMWDVTGVRIQQDVPHDLPREQYGIHLVITIL